MTCTLILEGWFYGAKIVSSMSVNIVFTMSLEDGGDDYNENVKTGDVYHSCIPIPFPPPPDPLISDT